MYGLLQAGKLANVQLQTFLAPHGYQPCPITLGLWMHASCDICFTLVMDDFAVRYMDWHNVKHLLTVLKNHYQVTEDWEASQYCGLTITWDYVLHTVDLAMPGYIEHALKQFQHPHPKHREHAPHTWLKPTYSAATQLTPEPDQTPALDATNCQHVQEVIGVLLYYSWAVDNSIGNACHPTVTRHTSYNGSIDAAPQLLCHPSQCQYLLSFQ